MAAGGGFAADEPRPFDLEATRAALTEVETALKDASLTDADLERLRADNDAAAVALQAAIAAMTPQLDAAAKRLAELTPKSKDAAPADATASAELNVEKKAYDELDAKLRAARALLLRADETATRIGAMRRELFARETFARSWSLFDPRLWMNVSREVPADARVMSALLHGWVSGVSARATKAELLGMAGIVALIALAAWPLGRSARLVVHRDPAKAPQSRLGRALAAAWTILLLTALPLIGLAALAYGVDAFNLSEPRTKPVVDALIDGARLVILVNAVVQGMLAPFAPAWRMIPFSDRSASLIQWGVMTIAGIWAVERLIEPAADAVASLHIAVAARALGSALVALVAAHTLRRLAKPLAGPPGSAQDAWAAARALVWAGALLIFAAAAAGYVAFAAFLVNQAIFLSVLASVLYLVDVIVQDGTAALLRPEAPVGARLFGLIGLKRDTLAQIVAVVQGVVRVVIVVVAAAAVLKPLGVQSQDMFGVLRAAYFGFTVGGVTLSLASIGAAAVVFAVALFATKLIQSWLAARFLPNTRLEPAVRNSIVTIFGYAGFIVAALLAAAQVGLDAQRLTIVAGALSVGIGFGLQGIANNFVSGLILLWERAIRVGDWIVVGAEQGTVRRINARSTEIETFDRGTLIVPNSNLVSGAVKNWVLSDRVGRVMISINVAYESDVEEVRDILLASAKAHDVLAIPAPTVQFDQFGEWALKFNLICFVDDIGNADRTRSDMNFDILRRLREANIRVPYPQFGQLRPGAK